MVEDDFGRIWEISEPHLIFLAFFLQFLRFFKLRTADDTGELAVGTVQEKI